jgi:hypothetical protein
MHCDVELEKRCTDDDQTREASKRTMKSSGREFEAAFKGAWTDTTKVQSAYSQLMNLKMKDLDVDTYNATFARLGQRSRLGSLMQRGHYRLLPIGSQGSHPTSYYQSRHHA